MEQLEGKNNLSIKRCHGLGNVILLLPVLDYIYEQGASICLITHEEWVEALAALRPYFKVVSRADGSIIDLDAMTSEVYPSQHRSDELGRFLGIKAEIPSVRIDRIGEHWRKPFAHLKDAIIFAPEAQHPSRVWPLEHSCRVKELFCDEQLVIIGTEREPDIPCDVDLRAQLSMTDLFGVLSLGKVIITMDSAVLHIAAALRKPTVAIFGGVDARYRVRPDQPVVVLQSKMDCCPCNKREICDERFDCIKNVEPSHVFQAVELARQNHKYINYYDLPAAPC